MNRFTFDIKNGCYLDGEEKIGVYEVVSRLNKGLGSLVYKYNLFDSSITENDEPISVSKVLLLLNGDLNHVETNDDYIKELEEENKYLKNKLRVLRNSIGNINTFLEEDIGEER